MEQIVLGVNRRRYFHIRFVYCIFCVIQQNIYYVVYRRRQRNQSKQKFIPEKCKYRNLSNNYSNDFCILIFAVSYGNSNS